MGEKLLVNVTQPNRIEAFEEAREAVIEDAEAGDIDVDMWQGDVPDGEVLRVLAEAYTGNLQVGNDL